MGAELGLALALVRRGRALVWAMIGLAVLAISDVPLSLETPGASARRPHADAPVGAVRM